MCLWPPQDILPEHSPGRMVCLWRESSLQTLTTTYVGETVLDWNLPDPRPLVCSLHSGALGLPGTQKKERNKNKNKATCSSLSIVCCPGSRPGHKASWNTKEQFRYNKCCKDILDTDFMIFKFWITTQISFHDPHFKPPITFIKSCNKNCTCLPVAPTWASCWSRWRRCTLKL